MVKYGFSITTREEALGDDSFLVLDHINMKVVHEALVPDVVALVYLGSIDLPVSHVGLFVRLLWENLGVDASLAVWASLADLHVQDVEHGVVVCIEQKTDDAFISAPYVEEEFHTFTITEAACERPGSAFS